MKRLLFPMYILILSILDCGKSPAATSTINITRVPTTSSTKLWYLTRGEAKSDQVWGVAVDSSRNIYTAG